ncbi:MAG: glycosyltransferase involved in cell wall biosynthesis [Candidatus Azotimanducaceae bacterium]|jgi:glycosyltransferase involved in cell wall biosynthesis
MLKGLFGGRSSRPEPKLSVIVIFYNMQREAKRTLQSLTVDYQRGIELSDYEVIVLDSNSTKPLDGDWVRSLQSNFRYEYVSPNNPSPCTALNHGASLARGNTLVNVIDGARILSPGVLANMLRAEQAFPAPFTYTLGMHLGHKRQNESISEGYNQSVEDELLASVPWESDGYSLFKISCLAGSSKEGFLNPIYESNCFAVGRDTLAAMGGFDEGFVTPGGGLVNLDVFRQLMSNDEVTPVMLVGEATFHQFHGGVATNVPTAENPWDVFDAEYEQLRGEKFQFVGYPKWPFFLGEIHPDSRRYFLPVEGVNA